MIDTTKPVRFFDDRGKIKEYLLLTRILFEDDIVCLCEVRFDDDDEFVREEDKYVLFKKTSGQVLTDTFWSWLAENS